MDGPNDELKLHIDRDRPCTIPLGPIAAVFCRFGTLFPMVVPLMPHEPDSFQWTWNGPSVKGGMPALEHMQRRTDLIGLIDRLLPFLPVDRPVMLVYTWLSTRGDQSRMVLRIFPSDSCPKKPLVTWSDWLWSFVATVDPVTDYTVPGSRTFDFSLTVI